MLAAGVAVAAPFVAVIASWTATSSAAVAARFVAKQFKPFIALFAFWAGREFAGVCEWAWCREQIRLHRYRAARIALPPLIVSDSSHDISVAQQFIQPGPLRSRLIQALELLPSVSYNSLMCSAKIDENGSPSGSCRPRNVASKFLRKSRPV
jgi:hypothetical protein